MPQKSPPKRKPRNTIYRITETYKLSDEHEQPGLYLTHVHLRNIHEVRCVHTQVYATYTTLRQQTKTQCGINSLCSTSCKSYANYHCVYNRNIYGPSYSSVHPTHVTLDLWSITTWLWRWSSRIKVAVVNHKSWLTTPTWLVLEMQFTL